MVLGRVIAWRRVLGGLVGVALVFLGGARCDPPLTHVLIGQQYQASGCLAASSSVDIVDGPAPVGICAPTCVVDPLGNIYVTQMCAPYPPLDTIESADTGPDPTCSMALDAFGAGTACGADAGAGSADASADAADAAAE